MIEHSNEPVSKDAATLVPPAKGIDVITYLTRRDLIGIALSVKDDFFGEVIVPLGGEQAARLHATLGHLLHLDEAEANEIITTLKERSK